MSLIGTVDSWAGNPLEVGPMYPWVGFEVGFFLVSLALWIGWMVWLLKTEGAAYLHEVQRLKQRDVSDVVGGEDDIY
tara:strand:- start:109 stop:339 length:231 start_codon:yes stop_codon:yes gene_type:complete